MVAAAVPAVAAAAAACFITAAGDSPEQHPTSVLLHLVSCRAAGSTSWSWKRATYTSTDSCQQHTEKTYMC
jgi:aspartate carbamoyltransferase catalytic subunit